MARIYKHVSPTDNKAAVPGKEIKDMNPDKGVHKDEKKEDGRK